MKDSAVLLFPGVSRPRPYSPHLAYRPDIDGLRAVAVLSVIGFHAFSGIFPGGYVGVDVFFVISGYLITSIICRQLSQDSFSFSDFYARRCKRLFPALISVLAAVLAFGWFFLLPNEYELLGKHIAAGAGFISNFAFWREAGSFDGAAETKPLLHLWSLGIVEQFYLIWPPLLVWAWKRKWDGLKIALSVVSVSFVVNVMVVSLWQSADGYYLPPTRFWELLLGAVLAYAHSFRKEETDRLLRLFNANLQAAIGLVLIICSVFALNKATLFPGWWALLPTIGTLLLISAGSQAWINSKLLANRWCVFIGLISYPLYLWHWPLLSYAQILAGGAPSIAVRAFAVCAAFPLSWLTYRAVEKPIRLESNRAAVTLAATLAVVGCLGLAAFAHQLRARSEKYGLENIINAATGKWDFPGPYLKSVRTKSGFHFERGEARHRVLFLGDSHIEQYYPRVDRLLAEHPYTSKSVSFVTQRSCLPIHDIPGITPSKCSGLVDEALLLARNPDVDTVVIGAAWNRYDVFKSPDGEKALQDLAATITALRKLGRQVFVILPIPRGEAFDPANLVHRSILDFGFFVRRYVDRTNVDDNTKPIDARLLQIAKTAGARTIDPVDSICPKTDCRTLAEDGMPVYTDDSHLRPGFVREHISFLDPIICTSGM